MFARLKKYLSNSALAVLFACMIGGMGYNALMTDGGMQGFLVAKAYAQSAMNLLNVTLSGHVDVAVAPGKLPPTVGTCGISPSVVAGSTDYIGQVTTGSGNKGTCTLTFSTAYTNTPACTVTSNNANSNFAYTPSTTAIVATGMNGSDKFSYQCAGHK
jgi:hypothetical protein